MKPPRRAEFPAREVPPTAPPGDSPSSEPSGGPSVDSGIDRDRLLEAIRALPGATPERTLQDLRRLGEIDRQWLAERLRTEGDTQTIARLLFALVVASHESPVRVVHRFFVESRSPEGRRAALFVLEGLACLESSQVGPGEAQYLLSQYSKAPSIPR